jgi:hypothetical protein
MGRGATQRLPDGNTLVSYGAPAWSDICFVIVNPKGEKLMKVNGPVGIYRVTNYPKLPFELSRPTITCHDSAGVKYLDAGADYKSYKWNTGETTRVIIAKEPNNYWVFVPDERGGYVSSYTLKVTDITSPCNRNPANNTINKGKKINSR